MLLEADPERGARWTLCFCVALLLPALAWSDANVEAQVSLDRNPIYYHEVCTLTLRVTARGVAIDKSMELQGLPDSTTVRFGEFKELQPEEKVVDGKVHETRRFITRVTGISTGSVIIAPSVRVTVMTRSRALFSSFVWEERRTIACPPVLLPVTPLPETGRPSDFSGAVGQFSYTTRVSPTELSVGDLATLTTVVSGTGYIENVVMPGFTNLPGFRVYEPRTVAAASDSIRVEQTIVPLTKHSSSVPSLNFSYFDPIRGSYASIAGDPLSLKLVDRAVAPPEAIPPVLNRVAPDRSRADAQPRRQRITHPAISVAFVALIAISGLLLASGLRLRRYATDPNRRQAASGRITLSILALLAAMAVPILLVLSTQKADPSDPTVLSRSVRAHIAPSASSVVTAEVPAGARPRILARHGAWMKIEWSGGNRGWVRADDLEDKRK